MTGKLHDPVDMSNIQPTIAETYCKYVYMNWV